ncbi:hypothetical protein SODALDRAFT_377107 [Sodiomyces alkalinus F11]|uniref:Uncharacterized protein n=1 Tax=Sodiomyces alkalinus (strain CBS 110278 / VKM F-3762 / F11) TaxID=1314773 RepID=A0A3N2Q3T7_SODAK|nr:hypothetical protein SODALDRAFT_377107 [Sodiomyces alkalinus F11]ROT41434.1 hypothetical protein SODALDRAFT_377107 [Sodiomyces alkalinus F11]
MYWACISFTKYPVCIRSFGFVSQTSQKHIVETMNWTEGGLQRHSRGRGFNPLIPKQKEFFARARLKLQEHAAGSSTSVSSIPPNRLDSGHQQRQKTTRERSSSIHSRSSHSSHGLPKKIRKDYRAVSRSSHSSRSSRLAAQGKASLSQNTQNRLAKNPNSSSPTPALSAAGKDPIPRSPNAAINDLDSKRRDLLLRGDWVSIGLQKSLPIKFPLHPSSPKNPKWGFGRRDVRSGEPMQSYGASRIRHKKLATDSSTDASRPANQMRIKIGSQDIHLGTSNETRSLRGPRKRSPSQWASGNRGSPKSSPYFHGRTFREAYVSHPSESKYSLHSLRSDGHLSSPRRRPLRNSLQSTSSPWTGSSHIEPEAVEDGHRASHVERSLFQPPEPQNQIFPETSSPLVHHPKPRRIARILQYQESQSPSSDGGQASVRAQVGQGHHFGITSSEGGQNDQWRSFITSPRRQSDISALQASGDSPSTHPKISPGISMEQPPRQTPREIPSRIYEYMHTNGSMEKSGSVGPAWGSPETVFSDWPPIEEEAVNSMSFHSSPSYVDPDCSESGLRGEHDGFEHRRTDNSEFVGSHTHQGVHYDHLADATKEDNTQRGGYRVSAGEVDEPNHLDSQDTGRDVSATPSSPSAPMAKLAESTHLQPDANEDVAWMTFLNSEVDDSDEVLQNAFDEATYETSRAIQPCDDSEEIDGDRAIAAVDGHVETVATCGSSTYSEQSIVETSPVRSGLTVAIPSTIASDQTVEGPSCLPTIFEGLESCGSSDSTEVQSELPAADTALHDNASIVAQPSEPAVSEAASPSPRILRQQVLWCSSACMRHLEDEGVLERRQRPGEPTFGPYLITIATPLMTDLDRTGARKPETFA